MLSATSQSMAMICRITGHQREQKKTPSSATDIFIPNKHLLLSPLSNPAKTRNYLIQILTQGRGKASQNPPHKYKETDLTKRPRKFPQYAKANLNT